MIPGEALLTVADMTATDRAAIAAGIPESDLMAAAGRAVADAIVRRFARRPTLVLCGPGNNGGDGWVVARLLAAWGWPVSVASLGPVAHLRGVSATMAADWTAPVGDVLTHPLDCVGLVVDALFGAGLSRDLDGALVRRLRAVERLGVPVVAVDVPSGVDGDTGAIRGHALRAALTVTFVRAKPGHLLNPGAARCGDLLVRPIGIADDRIIAEPPHVFRNGPALWSDRLPRPGPVAHKFDRGHLCILAGPEMTGAARLAAAAGRRAGAGLATLIGTHRTAPILGDSPGVLTLAADDATAVVTAIGARRWSSFVIGPGAGTGPRTAAAVATAAARATPVVLDADALTLFAADADGLAALIAGPTIVTPHDGEFARLFPGLTGDRLSRARRAAAQVGAVVLLKGSDTVVAHPDGRATILDRAPAALATAGSGDVLAGTIGGLLAAGMPAFEAASAAAWVHAEAGRNAGGGVIAEDLPELIGRVLGALVTEPGRG